MKLKSRYFFPPIIPILFIGLLIPLVSRAQDSPLKAKVSDSSILSMYAHGGYFAKKGKQVSPSTKIIRASQKYYLDALKNRLGSKAFNKKIGKRFALLENKTLQLVKDDIIANALLIDWLVEKTSPPEKGRISSINYAMRGWYINTIAKLQFKLVNNFSSKGVDPKVAKKLEELGATVFYKTTANGTNYIQECRDAGVPIPPPIFASTANNEWTQTGITIPNKLLFILNQMDADVWGYKSMKAGAVVGSCIALPRYFRKTNPDDKIASALGVICVNKRKGDACFWDNKLGVTIPMKKNGQGFSITDETKFIGGTDLYNGQCSDCHAGENPYIMHPYKPAFSAIKEWLLTDVWHKPHVPADWPQNPGPSNLLAVYPDEEGKCDSCHKQGNAGRFPKLSTDLSEYCRWVFRGAIGEGLNGMEVRTMPNDAAHQTHINTMKLACTQPPQEPGVLVPTGNRPDDPDFVSPPIIIGPLYACSTRIAVRGVALNGKVSVFIDGELVADTVSRDPDKTTLIVPVLEIGQKVTVSVVSDNTEQAFSKPTEVRDHTVDFPNGLPKPVISPDLVYQCASRIAVKHVNGAEVTVFTNGGMPSSRPTSSGYSVMTPGINPFETGDKFTATIKMCQDISGESEVVEAKPAPDVILPPELEEPLYEQQELVNVKSIVHGATVNMSNNTGETARINSWPTSWKPNVNIASQMGQPLSRNNPIEISQKLCKESVKIPTPKPVECNQLLPPTVDHPGAGDSIISVISAIPGSRIRIYDADGNEIGDGSGSTIQLSRTLRIGDVVTILQQVGTCTSERSVRFKVST